MTMEGKNFEPKHAAELDKETVAGKPLEELYGGYLGNAEIAGYIAKATEEPEVTDYIHKLKETGETIHVLEVGAGTGIVGKTFAKHLSEQGLASNLTLSDRNIEAFKEASDEDIPGVEVNKIVLDNKAIALLPNSAEFIVGRSFSHYEKDDTDELKVFHQIYNTLKPGGVFIDQAAGFPTETEAELWRSIQQLVGKVANLHTPEHTEQLLKQVFGEQNVTLAKEQPPAIHQTMQDFMRRFRLDEQSEIIQQIKGVIQQVPETERPSFKVAENNFEWDVAFTIFVSQKHE